MVLKTLKTAMRVVFGVFFIFAGVNHFRNPGFYLAMMPPYLPWHVLLVQISGVAEIALGALLLFRRWSSLAGWGLIALLIAIFPANLHMALHPELFPAFSRRALLIRLPIQAVLILWAYWYASDRPPVASHAAR